MRPLDVGVALGGPGNAAGLASLLGLAEWADRHGLHSMWLPEAHFRPGASPAPLLVLAALAARTRRVRLGTSSLLISVHDPLCMAAQIATLDRLSHGRVLLGLGRGFDSALFGAFGIDPGEKRDRFDRALDAMLAAWSSQSTCEMGAHQSGPLRPAVPSPLQRPHPPLWVAAFGRKGLEQAARRKLPYLASPLESLEMLERNHAFHRSRLPPDVDPRGLRVAVIRSLHVAQSGAEADRVREALGNEARRLGARGGTLARAAAGRLEDRVLVGEPGALVERIARYRERIGMDLVIARGAAGTDPASQRASLERLLEHVLPQLP